MNRPELLESIADTIADYREGDVPRRTPQHVERWVTQFPEEAQDGILAEVNHLLSQTYISRDNMTEFLRGLAKHEKFCGGDLKAFWKRANLLDIQRGGNSQRELLAMFGELLKQEVGVERADCGSEDGPYIYLDDGVFGGGRVVNDLSVWIEKKAPAECEVRIVVAALHLGGQYYAGKVFDKLKTDTKKKIKLSWWRILEVENRKAYKNSSDVLWPTRVPPGPLAEAYVRYLTEEEPKYKLELRSPGSVGLKKFFSSDQARILLEQQFLMAGLEIRDKNPRLPETIRPLGATLLKTFGFGSTIVTFRNCPNNCPLALWAGDPWFPLFPRSTNSEAFMKRLLESFQVKEATKE
uniref:PRTase-CE domain-containing protein n=1 Tax=Desulfobacca acetoxidans TaxID=60893 RepID=A0A7V4G8E3_9BACT